MPFGVSYAVYVGAIVLTLGTQNPSAEMRAKDAANGSWMVTLGKNAGGKDGIGRDGLASFDFYSEQEWFWNLKPIWAFALSQDGGAFASLGLRKDFYLGEVQISPYTGIALHQSDLSHFEKRELLQFRTGFDIMVPITDNASFSVGYYHMSNARNNEWSASLDVTRFGLVYRF